MNAAPSEALAAICSRPCCPEDVIGQAKGILMERLKITPEDAFDLLRRSSQHLNIMREVARGLAETASTGWSNLLPRRPSRAAVVIP